MKENLQRAHRNWKSSREIDKKSPNLWKKYFLTFLVETLTNTQPSGIYAIFMLYNVELILEQFYRFRTDFTVKIWVKFYVY